MDWNGELAECALVELRKRLCFCEFLLKKQVLADRARTLKDRRVTDTRTISQLEAEG